MVRGIRLLLTVALVLGAPGGCAAGGHAASELGEGQPVTHGPGPSRPPDVRDSGISGQTVLVACPVDRGDPACDAAPVPARLTVRRGSGPVIMTFDTDSQGHFAVTLAPGTYGIRPVLVNGRPARRPQTTAVTVTAGEYVPVRMRISNGLE